jgi:succinate dehydrogenase hydrophobic anchor subunit
MGGGSFIFQAITAVSILLVAVGIFYVLVKLGSFIDAMKEKTESGSAKK